MRIFFRMGGHHVQFNVVSTELLKEAQKRPQDFEDLMVEWPDIAITLLTCPRPAGEISLEAEQGKL